MTKLTNIKIIPVLLGADLNCYNVARAFHEEYGIISYAFGKYAIGATSNTKIIKFKSVENLDQPAILIDELNTFADNNKDAKLILIGCTDDYASLIIKNKDILSKKYITPYIDQSLMDKLILKEEFYKYCDKHNILYPKTYVYEKGMSFEILEKSKLGFSYPIIIKPSSSVLYWKYPFDNMKKVYKVESKAEAIQVINEIYKSGYPEKLILQDLIPGYDSNMYVLTSYSDKNGKVKMMCLGHVLLEEHTPKGLGNHAAIITEYNSKIMNQFKSFLEDIGYTGFSNFDIKYDPRDDSYRAFEINLRQGRSNYYVTGSGNNIAKLIVEDWILNKQSSECIMNKTESYWHSIPTEIIYKYVKEKDLTDKVRKLIKEKKASSSLWYDFDIRGNLKRRLFVLVHSYHHFGKFKKYYN